MCFIKKLFSVMSVASVVLLMGCASSGPAYEAPANFKEEVAFDTVWEAGSSGEGKVRLNLAPNFVMHNGQQWVAIPDHKGNMRVVDALTGDDIWRTKTGLDFSSAAGESEDLIIMGTSDGQVVAMSKASGEMLWTTQVSSEVLAAPRGNKDAIVVLTIDSRLHGLDAKTGKERWTFDATAPALTLRGASSPIIIEDVAFVGFSNGQVGMFRLTDGQMIWLEAAAKPRGRNEIERMVDINGTMSRVGNMVYVVTYHGNLLAVNIQSLEVVWSNPMSSYVGLTASGNQLIVTDADDNVYSIDRTTGETRWKQGELVGRYLTAPAIYDQYVAVGDVSGYLYALSVDNGRLLGYNRLFSAEMRAPVLVDAQGVIVQSHTGSVEKIAILPKQGD